MNILISVCEDFLKPAKIMLYSLSNYFRLLAPYILPESIDRILYLDADISRLSQMGFVSKGWLTGLLYGFVLVRYQ